MNNFKEDAIITEVRKNRSELLSDFDGDAKKLVEHLMSLKPAMEAEGWRYETDEELEACITWQKKRREAEQRLIEAI